MPGISNKYLTPDYKEIAKAINFIHGSNYLGKHMKWHHKGADPKTSNTIKVEIDSLVGTYEKWFGKEEK